MGQQGVTMTLRACVDRRGDEPEKPRRRVNMIYHDNGIVSVRTNKHGRASFYARPIEGEAD